MTTQTVTFGGITPYLFYDDAAAMLEWYSRVFGWIETGRWPDENGRVQNAEMTTGGGELWLDGSGRRYRDADGKMEMWVGVWVDDPDAMYARVRDAGITCDAPEDKPYGVRTLTVTDPEGYQWGFMSRLA